LFLISAITIAWGYVASLQREEMVVEGGVLV